MSTNTTERQLHRLGHLPPVRDYVRQVWERREFAWNVAMGEMRAQNFDTVLGNLWHLLNPLFLVAVYFVMFGIILDISRGTENFIAFLTVGVFTYTFMQKAITSGAAAIVGNLGLIRSLQFPRAVLPLASVTKETLAYASSLVVLVVVVLLTETQTCTRADAPAACDGYTVVDAEWLMFLPALVLMLLFVVGASLVTARLTDHIRDTTNFLPYLFRLGFYLSGVLYEVDRFISSDLTKAIFIANPFYAYITLIRESFMTTFSSSDLGWMWVSAGIWAPAMFVFGLLFFRARENRYGRG